MGQFPWDEKWLEILDEQEKLLEMEQFSRMDALKIGTKIVELCESKYHGNVAMNITQDNMSIFSHKMAGTDVINDVWMLRKSNVSKMLDISSLRALLEIKTGIRGEAWDGRDDCFVACGGCVPIKIRGVKTYIYIMVSGLEHYLDHQVIIDAIADHLNVDVPSIV